MWYFVEATMLPGMAVFASFDFIAFWLLLLKTVVLGNVAVCIRSHLYMSPLFYRTNVIRKGNYWNIKIFVIPQ